MAPGFLPLHVCVRASKARGTKKQRGGLRVFGVFFWPTPPFVFADSKMSVNTKGGTGVSASSTHMDSESMLSGDTLGHLRCGPPCSAASILGLRSSVGPLDDVSEKAPVLPKDYDHTLLDQAREELRLGLRRGSFKGERAQAVAKRLLYRIVELQKRSRDKLRKRRKREKEQRVRRACLCVCGQMVGYTAETTPHYLTAVRNTAVCMLCSNIGGSNVTCFMFASSV